MTTSSRKLGTAAALFLLPLSLHASVESVLDVQLKCQVQKELSTSGREKEGEVTTVRLDSKQLLKIIGKKQGVEYPKGSQLRVATNGQIYVINSSKKVVANVSPYLKASLASSNRLFDGYSDSSNGEQESTNYYRFGLTFNVFPFKGSIRGNAVERFEVSEVDDDGLQVTEGETTVTVNGLARYEGRPTYIEGTLRLEGRKVALKR